MPGRESLKVKAQDIADRLTVAFDTETGIPMSQVNLQKYDDAAI